MIFEGIQLSSGINLETDSIRRSSFEFPDNLRVEVSRPVSRVRRSVTEGVARLNYCLNGSPLRLLKYNPS